MSNNISGANNSQNTDENIVESKFYLSKRYYLTISVLTTIALWLVTTTYLVLQYIIVAPIEQDKERAEKSVSELSSKNDELLENVYTLQKKFDSVIETIDRPVLLYPENEVSTVKKQVEFNWDYKDHDLFTNYVIEIKRIAPDSDDTNRYNVTRPVHKSFYLPIQEGQTGTYIWRVNSGRMIQERLVNSGKWSDYRTFSVYSSVWERINQTKTLTVGMSPTLSHKFNVVDGKGQYSGFDYDLCKMIAEKLKELNKLDGEIKISIIEIDWEQLLTELHLYSVDIVVSSMTITDERERLYDIKFSDPYYRVNPMLVAPKSSLLKVSLNGDHLKKRKVGAAIGTTNLKAAKYFAGIYKYDVVEFDEYSDLYQALFDGIIDAALVDDVLANEEIRRKRLKDVSPEFGTELSSFFKEHYGQKAEYYGIAVARRGGEDLLEKINEVLHLDEMKSFLEDNKSKYGLSAPESDM